MNRTFSVLLASALIFLCLAGCGNESKSNMESSTNADPSVSVSLSSDEIQTPADSKPVVTQSAEQSAEISVVEQEEVLDSDAIEPEDLQTVTIPAELATGAFETMDLDAACENNGWHSGTRSDDGSITFTMSQEKKDEFCKMIARSMVNGVSSTVVGRSMYSYISAVEFDSDGNRVVVTASSDYLADKNAVANSALGALILQAADNTAKITGPVAWEICVIDSSTSETIESYEISTEA